MEVKISQLCKSYGSHLVLDRVDMNLAGNGIYCLMAPSGSGKTTLLRILLGLEQADSGSVTLMGGKITAAVFQENRLCNAFSPLENVRITAEKRLSRDDIIQELTRLLPAESIERPVSTLSGGMKRRTAVCRALLAGSDGIVMDEPFTGLDLATKKQVISYIKEKAAGKLAIITTHQREDVELLEGRLIALAAPCLSALTR